MCLDHVNYRLYGMSENYGSTKVQSLKHVRVGAGSGRHGRRRWHGVPSAEGKQRGVVPEQGTTPEGDGSNALEDG